MNKLSTSVVIPNWNGKELLEKNLSAVMAIGADEVIVVENGSTDGSIEYLRELREEGGGRSLKVIENEKNLGFARGVNQGVKAARGDVIILLNTDVIPEKDLSKHTLPHFENPDVFAVSFNEEEWSWARGCFKKGLIEHTPGEKTDKTHISFWASGGSAAFSRKKWVDLGGFNLIYEPFYWEDTDISYRAQKKGWKVLWEPRAKVVHRHEATVGKHALAKKKDIVGQRNQLLFFWCNVSSPAMWLSHFMWMPIRLLRLGYWTPFIWAILKLPKVVIDRMKNSGGKVTDEEILDKFKD